MASSPLGLPCLDLSITPGSETTGSEWPTSLCLTTYVLLPQVPPLLQVCSVTGEFWWVSTLPPKVEKTNFGLLSNILLPHPQHLMWWGMPHWRVSTWYKPFWGDYFQDVVAFYWDDRPVRQLCTPFSPLGLPCLDLSITPGSETTGSEWPTSLCLTTYVLLPQVPPLLQVCSVTGEFWWVSTLPPKVEKTNFGLLSNILLPHPQHLMWWGMPHWRVSTWYKPFWGDYFQDVVAFYWDGRPVRQLCTPFWKLLYLLLSWCLIPLIWWWEPLVFLRVPLSPLLSPT